MLVLPGRAAEYVEIAPWLFFFVKKTKNFSNIFAQVPHIRWQEQSLGEKSAQEKKDDNRCKGATR